jgi:CO/xanthine dehydrogenase FAD-binding subunit
MRYFEYHSPNTITDASELLNTYKDKARVLAGGTDLIPNMHAGKYAPEHIVNIKSIPGLNKITHDTKTGLTLGPLVKLNELIYSDVLRDNYPILCEVAQLMASHQVRNLATVGGNLCNAAPSADTAPILIALDSTITIMGSGGDRCLALEEFFSGPGSTALEYGELLTKIQVPPIPPRTGLAYIKHGTRKALEIAVVGVAALIQLEDKSEVCKSARVVVAACAPTPLRVPSAEKLLIGKKLSDRDFELASNAASEAVSPITDVRACDTYRREMVKVQCKRALELAGSRVYSTTKTED